jgi:hypothetical protein
LISVEELVARLGSACSGDRGVGSSGLASNKPFLRRRPCGGTGEHLVQNLYRNLGHSAIQGTLPQSIEGGETFSPTAHTPEFMLWFHCCTNLQVGQNTRNIAEISI